MKNHLVLLMLFCLLSISNLKAQDYTTTELYLNIKTDDDKPVPNTTVWLVETVTGEELPSVTNGKGSVNFTVYKGKTYSVNFKDKKEHTIITISEKQTTLLAKTIRYTPPEMMGGNNTVEVKMDTINQDLAKGVKPKKTETLVHIKLENTDGMPVKNTKIGVVFAPLKTVYVSWTDDKGIADFLLLNDKEYKVDVANIPNYHTFFTPPMGGLNMDRVIKFEGAGIVSQDTINDTIRQVLPRNVHATSMEAYVNVLVNNYDGIPLANEEVYLRALGDSVVYFSKTGTSGQAKFLLPKGKKYAISFKYDSDVDVLDYQTDMKGNIRTEVEFTYIGTVKIEEFYAKAKRDQEGLLVDFISVEAVITSLDKKAQYEKTDIGFNLFFGPYAYMMPPTIYEDQIFTSGGVNDNLFLSYNRFNGDFKWGAELKEGGVSASVCTEDVVLVITESCTLYAFDTKTGKPLWGKWLSEWMFSSPTANDKYVYAVYKDEMVSPAKFVFICLELETGNLVWQTEIESDILTTPVLADDKVYITTQNGYLHQYNATSGQQTGILKNVAATLPTITSDKIFIGELTDPHTMTLKCYTKDLKPVVIGDVTMNVYGDATPSRYMELMYHCGFRVTNYNNLNYNIVNDQLICSDPVQKKVIWRKEVFPDTPPENVYPDTYQPVITGGKILVATPEGLVQLYNAKTGDLIKQYVMGKTLVSQPVAYEGWIFIGTNDGYLMGIDTKDDSLTGWSTWCGNSSHNTAIK